MTLFFAARFCLLHCWLFLLVTLSLLDKAQCIQLPPSITTRTYHFNLTLNSLNPDCSNYTNHDTLLINGLMPGPTIIASTGDRILVHFRNKLPTTTGNSTEHNDPRLDANAATLHFHGIHQHGSVKSDGVPFLTQDPVAPGGGHYLYDFLVGEQSGTFYYHAHVGLQDFFGAFIVYESDQANPGIMQKQQQLSIQSGNSTITYDDERTLMLSEWYHRDRSDLESLIIGPDYSRIPDADSLLINGMAIHNQQHPSSSCAGYPTINVTSHHTYRLRVIGATTYRTLGFAIAHHRFTIIEVDGYLVRPYETDYLEIAPGQRFSVLLKADQPAKAYTIGANRRYITNKSLLDASKLSKGWAILKYDTMDNANDALPHDRPVFPANDTPQWIWNELTPAGNNDHHMGILDKQPARTIVLNTTSGREIRNGKSVQRFYINNVTYDTPAVSILGQIFNGTRPTSRYTIPQLMMTNSTRSQFGQGYDPELKTYPLEHLEIVDFVIQNTHTPGLPCHQHPWHTHGKSHWVIAYGSGAYNETLHGHIRNVPNPLLKDITVIYPSLDASTPMAANSNRSRQTYPKDETAGCGWSKIRIIADNPGIWALHCHITPHMLQGMMVVLEESPGLIRSHSHLVKLEHRTI